MKRIKTSEENKNVVALLTKKFEFKDDRNIGQIAIAYSLQMNKRFDLSSAIETDNNGKEYPETLLGNINGVSNDKVYHAILNQLYEKPLTEEEFQKLTKLHLDHGLGELNKRLLQNNKGKNAHIDFMLSIMNHGLSLLNNSSTSFKPTANLKDVDAYSKELKIEIGKDSKTKEPIVLAINNERDFDSQHIALAGMNGSGKTELVKDILFQLREQSEEKLNFIFFDYKGEGKSEKLKKFLTATKCEFIDIKEAPFVFNPLRNIPMNNERDKSFGIKAFKDTVASIDKRISIRQQTSLEVAIRECFNAANVIGKYPSLQDVYEQLEATYLQNNQNPDTLTAIMRELAGDIFADDFDPDYKVQDKSLYVNLPPTLGDTVRQATVFIILNYLLSEFISYNDVQTSAERIKPIRYVIVIDEAHAYLGNKNMAKVLENLLRMIRSKGVIIMLVSQGIEEYKQKDFDFSSQIKIPILLNIQNKDPKLAKSFLGTPKSEIALSNALKGLESTDDGEKHGVLNLKETKLFDINMFYKRM